MSDEKITQREIILSKASLYALILRARGYSTEQAAEKVMDRYPEAESAAIEAMQRKKKGKVA